MITRETVPNLESNSAIKLIKTFKLGFIDETYFDTNVTIDALDLSASPCGQMIISAEDFSTELSYFDANDAGGYMIDID